jgi:hypothetical protein
MGFELRHFFAALVRMRKLEIGKELPQSKACSGEGIEARWRPLEYLTHGTTKTNSVETAAAACAAQG